MTRRGYITTYQEQGAEGRVEWVLIDETLQARGEPPFIFLTSGQRLNIESVWQGIIDLVPLSATDSPPHNSQLWADTKQRHVPYSKWFEWFTQTPPLRAELSD